MLGGRASESTLNVDHLDEKRRADSRPTVCFDSSAALPHRCGVSRFNMRALTLVLPVESPRKVPPNDDEAFVAAIRAAQEGSTESVRTLLHSVAPTVRRTCRLVLGADHPDLEDAIQDSLFATVQALAKYRFAADLRSYVSTIALRTAIAARRRSAARWRQHEPIEESVHPDSSPWEDTESLIEGMQVINRILEQVTGVQREALLMRVLLGFSVEEIAGLTGVSPNTVKTRLRRGKDALRRGGDKAGFWKRMFARRA